MKTSVDVYDQRLLLFAERVTQLQPTQGLLIREAWIIEYDREYVMSFDMTYFFELPAIFGEWSYYEPADEVEIKSYPKHLGMVGMAMKFFNLTPEEFIELFSYQDGLSGQELASEIIQFVEERK